MGKIPVSDLIVDFQMMARGKWTYGADTRRGNVDCSGAFVWAYRRHGNSIYHGSNRMARVEVDRLIPIDQAVIVPGMAAFKHREPDQPYYALPSGYQPGGKNYNGDLNDYYHVGLVDEDVGQVLNAQGEATGFVSSPISQNWSHVGYLKQVDYGSEKGNEDMNEAKTATVTAANGTTVNLRKTPGGDLVDRVPVGTKVTVVSQQNGWSRVEYDGKVGWMMDQYLTYDNQQPEGQPTKQTVTILLPRDLAEQLRDALTDAIGWG